MYMILTILACIGFGEHYTIDLVAAVPYALLLQAVCASPDLRSRSEWKESLVAGLVLTFAWIVVVRFGTPLFRSVSFAWAMSIVTLAICGFARRRMLAVQSRQRTAVGVAA